MKPWCVKSLERDKDRNVIGERWCEMKHQAEGSPDVSATSVETRCCGMFVILPAGIDRRDPTCDGTVPPGEEEKKS
jgi:hypothetical protein